MYKRVLYVTVEWYTLQASAGDLSCVMINICGLCNENKQTNDPGVTYIMRVDFLAIMLVYNSPPII